MAQYPCDHCGQRYRGPGNRAYIAVLDGWEKWQHKPRLCPRQLQELIELFELVDGEIDPEDNSPYREQPCLVCAQSVVGRQPQSVFMTAYVGRDTRRDFYAPMCGPCRDRGQMALMGLVGPSE